ncbi:protein MLP2 isoform X2 [Dendroctonus ponderosae]|uniref:Uncharacterized protein n=1 Tax=Dendroctonus ponderosae TaxID=77166 RepID=A0AAR5PIY5_DENPD|nr:protein MLP2 isoform X2 [Dendroctonus ponderosae]
MVTRKQEIMKDDHQQQRVKLKMSMDQKHIYYEDLQQQEKTLKSNNASKDTSLTMTKDRQRAATEKNSYYRKIIDEICESVNAAYENIYEISENLNNNQEKLQSMGKNANNNVSRSDKKIGELVTIFNQLKDKRKKGLEELEIQMTDIGKENTELNHKNTEYENILLSYADNDEDLSELIEKELTELQGKLSTLHDEYSAITEEARTIDTCNEEVADKYQESIFSELESQLSNIILDVAQLCQNKDHQKTVEHKLTTFVQTLEDSESTLNAGLNDTVNIWTEVLQNDYMRRHLKLRQEIEEIRAYIGNHFKPSVGEKTYLNSLESLEELDENISNTTTDVTQLSTELNKIEHLLDSLKNSDDLSQKIQTVTNRIDQLYNEKAAIQISVNATSDEIQKATEQLPEKADKGELAILTFENTSLLEVKVLNKQHAEMQEIRIKLDDELKALENQLKELEASINARKQEAELVSQRRKDIDSLIRSQQTSAAPTVQMHTKKTAAHHDFTRPKTPESSTKKRKTAQSANIKKNWDSDSSMEEEIVNLSDLLKAKQRKRRTTEK